MEEAKFSINIKYRLRGYESQITMRTDEPHATNLLDQSEKALNWLQAHDAEPTNGKNGKAAAPPERSKSQATEMCPTCRAVGQMELIEWTEKDGTPRAEWKCQACKKWLSSKK